jgi:TatA/E family protein of Tat protein translocase
MELFGVGPTEVFVVLIVILVLFGPEKLPEFAKKIGGASRELRDNLNAMNDEMNSALEASMNTDKARLTPPPESPQQSTLTDQSETPSDPSSPTLSEASPQSEESPTSSTVA